MKISKWRKIEFKRVLIILTLLMNTVSYWYNILQNILSSSSFSFRIDFPRNLSPQLRHSPGIFESGSGTVSSTSSSTLSILLPLFRHVSNSKENAENRCENIETRQVLIFRLAYRFVASF